MPTRRHDITNEMIAASYAGGLATRAIAEHFGIGKSTVFTRLQAAGVLRRSRGKKGPRVSDAARITPSESARRKRYGLSRDQLVSLFNSQNGLCGICARPISLGRRGFHVDHDHASKRVRGLLCHGCNPPLGWFERNSSQIVAYLSRHHCKMHCPDTES